MRSSGNQMFWVYEVSMGLSKVFSTLQEVGILLALVYFHSKGCLVEF